MATPFGPARRSRFAAARYWTRLFWFPVLCLLLALIAFQQSNATNNEVAERARVELSAAQTPVLSARRLPNVLALPSQAVQLQPAVLGALNGVPPDTTCASVTNSRGVTVFEHNPNLLLTPASNQKVLLAYAVLNHFQPDRTFGTFVATDAQIIANVVQGNVWLIGTGDPVLTTENYAQSFAVQPQVHTSFEELADRLKTAGVTRIRGNVIGLYPAYGAEHGFGATLWLWPGAQNVCAYAINLGAGPGYVGLGCKGLDPMPPAGSGGGRRIVYANLSQRLWLIGADGFVDRTYPISGKYLDPGPGTYQVYAFQRYADAGHDGITMEYFVAFNPAGLGYGFHTIPTYADGTPLQSESELGFFRSAGCVRQRRSDAVYMWNWARAGDPVVVLAR